MSAGVDDLDRRVSELVLESVRPPRFEKLVVRSPENQGRGLDLLNVSRAAHEIAIVQGARGTQVGAASAEVLEGTGPFINELIRNSALRHDAGFQALSPSFPQIDDDHD